MLLCPRLQNRLLALNPRIPAARTDRVIARQRRNPPPACLEGFRETMDGTAAAVEAWTAEQEHFMELALEQAHKALEEREVPVGCVIVKDGAVIGKGHNLTNAKRNGTAHAEFQAIDEILATCGDATLAEFHRCQLYVTCEPCIMCAGALSLVGIGEVIFGCYNDKFGGAGSILDVHEMGSGVCNGSGARQGRWGSVVQPGRGFKSRGGLFAGRAIKMLQDFYICGNPAAPKPHRSLKPPSWEQLEEQQAQQQVQVQQPLQS